MARQRAGRALPTPSLRSLSLGDYSLTAAHQGGRCVYVESPGNNWSVMTRAGLEPATYGLKERILIIVLASSSIAIVCHGRCVATSHQPMRFAQIREESLSYGLFRGPRKGHSRVSLSGRSASLCARSSPSSSHPRTTVRASHGLSPLPGVRRVVADALRFSRTQSCPVSTWWHRYHKTRADPLQAGARNAAFLCDGRDWLRPNTFEMLLAIKFDLVFGHTSGLGGHFKTGHRAGLADVATWFQFEGSGARIPHGHTITQQCSDRIWPGHGESTTAAPSGR
jgi:hypothetical protein